MPIYAFDEVVPAISDCAYVAPTAIVIGDEHSDMMVRAKTVYVDLARRYPSALKEISLSRTRKPG